MEELFRKNRKHSLIYRLASEPVNLEDFMKTFEPVKEILEKDLQELVGADSQNQLQSIVYKCRPPVLTSKGFKSVVYSDGVKRNFEFYDLPKNPSCLKSIEYLRRRTKAQSAELQKSVHYPFEINLESINHEKAEEFKAKLKRGGATSPSLTPHSDFLLTLKVFITSGPSGKQKVMREIRCLSTTTLASLKEMIHCPKDYQPTSLDVSLNPICPDVGRAKDVLKSSFFYFDQGFYLDELPPPDNDLSGWARQWFDRNKWPYEIGDMKDVQLKDIKIRLRHPYVYCHQSYCEHLIAFTDLKILTPTDDLNPAAYPILISFSCPKYQVCHLCEQRAAKFLVDNCERLPRKHVVTCSICLLRYCYNGSEKIGDFKVYKYVQRVAIL